MTTDETLDAFFERGYELPDGFFLKLRSGDFDPDASACLMALIRKLSLSSDHKTNYRLLWLLWGAQFDIDAAVEHGIGGEDLRRLKANLLYELIRIFGSELHALIERLDKA